MPGTDKLRPVLQAEDYGKRLGQVTLTFDPASGAVTLAAPRLIDVVGAPQDPAVAGDRRGGQGTPQELGQRPLGTITADIKRAYTRRERGPGQGVGARQLHRRRAARRHLRRRAGAGRRSRS